MGIAQVLDFDGFWRPQTDFLKIDQRVKRCPNRLAHGKISFSKLLGRLFATPRVYFNSRKIPRPTDHHHVCLSKQQNALEFFFYEIPLHIHHRTKASGFPHTKKLFWVMCDVRWKCTKKLCCCRDITCFVTHLYTRLILAGENFRFCVEISKISRFLCLNLFFDERIVNV